MRTLPLHAVALLLAVLALGGCDALGFGGTTVVEGVVTDAATDEPLDSVFVALEQFGGGIYPLLDWGFTDAEGHFRLATQRTDIHGVTVNRPPLGSSWPYDPTYQSPVYDVRPRRRQSVRVALDSLRACDIVSPC